MRISPDPDGIRAKMCSEHAFWTQLLCGLSGLTGQNGIHAYLAVVHRFHPEIFGYRYRVPLQRPNAASKSVSSAQNSSIWHTFVYTSALNHSADRAHTYSQSCRAHLHQCLMDRYTIGDTSCVFFGSIVVVQVGPFKIALFCSAGAMRPSLSRYRKSHWATLHSRRCAYPHDLPPCDV